MARAANGPVFGRAAHDIFSGWISPSRQPLPEVAGVTFSDSDLAPLPKFLNPVSSENF